MATPAFEQKPPGVTWSPALVRFFFLIKNGQIRKTFGSFEWFEFEAHVHLFVGDVNTVAEPFPFEMENGTEPYGSGKIH